MVLLNLSQKKSRTYASWADICMVFVWFLRYNKRIKLTIHFVWALKAQCIHNVRILWRQNSEIYSLTKTIPQKPFKYLFSWHKVFFRDRLRIIKYLGSFCGFYNIQVYYPSYERTKCCMGEPAYSTLISHTTALEISLSCYEIRVWVSRHKIGIAMLQ